MFLMQIPQESLNNGAYESMIEVFITNPEGLVSNLEATGADSRSGGDKQYDNHPLPTEMEELAPEKSPIRMFLDNLEF